MRRFILIFISINILLLFNCNKEKDPCAIDNDKMPEIEGWDITLTNPVGIGQIPADHDISDFHFLNDQQGFVTTYFVGAYHTNDAGKNWIKLNLGTDVKNRIISEVFFLNENIGWIALDSFGSDITGDKDYQTKILKTSDGSLTWNTISTNLFGNFQMLMFANELEGLGIHKKVGENCKIVYTHDGGATWTTNHNIDLTSNLPYWQVFNSNTIYIEGSGGKIWKSSDVGNTWYLLASGIPAIKEFEFVNDSIFYCITNNKLTKFVVADSSVVIDTDKTSIIHFYNENEGLIIKHSIECKPTDPTANLDEGLRAFYGTKDGGQNWSASTNNNWVEPSRYKFFTPEIGFTIHEDRLIAIRKI